MSEDELPKGPPSYSIAFRGLPDGQFETTYLGPVPKGENSSESAVHTLIAILNLKGEGWSEPRRVEGREQGIDFEAIGARGTLRLQVTRVPHDPVVLKSASRQGHVVRRVDGVRLAADIWKAVQQKAAKTAQKDRPSITLVLDASRAPGYDMPQTHLEFFQRYQPEAVALGFEDILLVGTMAIRAMLTPLQDYNVWFRIPGA